MSHLAPPLPVSDLDLVLEVGSDGVTAGQSPDQATAVRGGHSDRGLQLDNCVVDRAG